MRPIITYFFILFFLTKSFAKDVASDSLKSEDKRSNTSSQQVRDISKSVVDTLFVYNKSISDPQAYDWSKNMPWVSAILIGLLTVVGNIIVSSLTRKANSKVALQQIENSKKIANEQMRLLQINNERDFKKTVVSGSIQLWLNDFRNTMSEILSCIEIVRFKEVLSDDVIYKLHLLLSKSEIMLGTLENSKLVDKIEELKAMCLAIPTGNKDFYHLDQLIAEIKSEALVVIREQSDLAKQS